MLGEEPTKSKIVLNPFAVRFDVSSEYPPVKEFYNIAMVGRFEMLHKGHDILLEVLQQSKWQSRPVHFNLYGSGSHQQLFDRLLKRSGVSNVFLKGQTNNVAEIWETNHLLILPSRMEGQALVLIEAMWCYRGAVVTNVGGANELIIEGETGFMANYPTIEDVDKTLEKAWEMRDQWQQIGYDAGRKIREIYKEHPITTFAKELKSLLPA
jgi:glycosyltransferase involved in cell wall biosynthesis